MTTARTEILTRIRTILSRPDLPFPPVDPPPLTAAERMTVTHAEGTLRQLAERFGQELTALYGSYEILDSAVEVRLALGSALLLPFLWRDRARFSLQRWPMMALIAALNSALPFLLFA